MPLLMPVRVSGLLLALSAGFLSPVLGVDIFPDTTRPDSGIFYQGEGAAREIRLTPSNGFFTVGAFQAVGETPSPAEEQSLIRQHFTALVPRDGVDQSDNPDATARWHVWTEVDQELRATIRFEVPPEISGTKWELRLGDYQAKSFTVKSPQTGEEQVLTFRHLSLVAGKNTLSLRRVDGSGAPRLLGLDLALSEPARLLRTRWRPAAVHTRYAASTCSVSKLWVFETRSLLPETSYSPMTTEFGYFGAGFGADGRPAGNVNFSMWAASAKSQTAPPLDAVPHLLATGNPDADFSGFGHEGSGVKLRNWSPYLHHPESVIQALRVETIGDRNVFYGYLFDERISRWVLFAAGSKPIEPGKPLSTLRLSSFCEIPGPAARQRTGDIQRVMQRRGWVLDANHNWHVVDTQHLRIDGEPVSKQIGTTAGGWLTMATGGMEFVKPPAEVKLVRQSNRPDYLAPHHVTELFALPVEFDKNSVSGIDGSSATIAYEFADAGPNARAILYYGETDCFTAISRDLHGTERKGVSAQMLATNRTWSHGTEERFVTDNTASWTLVDLKPGTRYFFRVLVMNARGKSWAFSTDSFTTD